MTKRSRDNATRVPEAPKTLEHREQDRWLTMARCSRAITTANSAGERMACMEAIREAFRDVPDQQPGEQDTTAYARFAAKTLLEALTKPEASVATGNMFSATTENVFNEWIDEWLPPANGAGIKVPRM